MLPTPSVSSPEVPSTPVSNLVVRVLWMVVGHMALVLCALSIASPGSQASWITDAVYWLAAVAIVVLRYVDVTRCSGKTAYGEPATLEHWKRHAVGLAIGAPSVWLLAHAIAWLAG